MSYGAYRTQFPSFLQIDLSQDRHPLSEWLHLFSSDHMKVLHHHHLHYIDFYSTVCSTDYPFVGAFSHRYNSLSLFMCCLAAQRL
jgi:hypothetical protein